METFYTFFRNDELTIIWCSVYLKFKSNFNVYEINSICLIPFYLVEGSIVYPLNSFFKLPGNCNNIRYNVSFSARQSSGGRPCPHIRNNQAASRTLRNPRPAPEPVGQKGCNWIHKSKVLILFFNYYNSFVLKLQLILYGINKFWGIVSEIRIYILQLYWVLNVRLLGRYSWVYLEIFEAGTLLAIIALSAVQSPARTLTHNAILFINISTILGTTTIIL